MTENAPNVTLGSWLADLPDDRLVRLLQLRPDLAQPPPGSIAALAARAQARQSINAACDDLDFLHLAVLDALLVLHADTTAVPVAKLTALLGERAPHDAVEQALADLADRALAWGDSAVQVAPEAGAGLPWYPGQVTVEADDRGADELITVIEDLDDAQREVLERLVSGSPIGRTRDAAPGAPADRPVPRLLAAGLLRQLDDETVILPRRVGQVLRVEEPGPEQLTAPDPVVATHRDVDAAAAGVVIDLLREVDVVLDQLGAVPAAELRTGGLGVREVRRLAKTTGIDEVRLSLILSLTAAAGLIASGIPDPEPEDGEGPFWAPTIGTDRFADLTTAQRWHVLARTWLELPARPSLIGSRGPDGKTCGALSDALYSTAAPLDRRLLLELLADLPAGSAVDVASASAALVWRRPRWARRLQPEPVEDLLEEAHALGLVGRGALSAPGRALLGAEDPDDTAVVAAMDRALPAPIDHFLVQADLTVVVPGPLERPLAEELGVVATVESAGAAMVYRISEASLRHALDTGRTGAGLQAFFEKHSKTPIPQGLTYLIDDVARRHGQLRIGVAAAFIRCDDAALLAQAVAIPDAERLALRALAPTVAVAQAPIAEVLTALRDAGFAPAAEDATGAVVDLRPGGARVPGAVRRRSYRPPPPPNPETLGAIVGVLRKVTAGPFDTVRQQPGTILMLLKQAALAHADVVLGYVDAAGVATQRVVSPISVAGGQLVAFDSATSRVREFAVHRITSVVSATSG